MHQDSTTRDLVRTPERDGDAARDSKAAARLRLLRLHVAYDEAARRLATRKRASLRAALRAWRVRAEAWRAARRAAARADAYRCARRLRHWLNVTVRDRLARKAGGGRDVPT